MIERIGVRGLVQLALVIALGADATSASSSAEERPDAQQPVGAMGAHYHHEGGLHSDDPAPIGVMGDHLHHEGSFMLSYRYMRMHMDGNRDGTDSLSVGEILRPAGTYVATPKNMDMQMHMLGAMYAPKNWVTLMVMFPFVVLDMDHVTASGARFTTRSKGLGDIRTSALIKLYDDERHRLHANAGISWPSGSISRKDDTPVSMGEDVVLPYPMQLGSGTVDLLPGLTYNGRRDLVSWGSQAMGNIRLGRNKENYRLGNKYTLTAWGGAKLLPWLSTALRLEWRQWFDIEGSDDRLGAPMGIPAKDFIPTADPDLRAGKQLDLGPSLNLMAGSGPLQGLRFGFEMLFPIYRDLDGPQLETDWTLMSGFQYEF